MEKYKYIAFTLITFLLASCEKEENLWSLSPAGPEKLATVGMGENYDHAIFFQLSTGAMVDRNPTSWDLAFASGNGDFTVMMNGGKGVQVYNTEDTVFSKQYKAEPTSDWQWDNPNGDKDSAAIGKWMNESSQSKMEVYVLDLGSANTPRYKKIQFLKVTSSEYTIRYANMDNSADMRITIPKDSSRNYTYFNLGINSTIDFEPNAQSWEIVFTKYRHVYYDLTPITPYPVTGVLSNRGRVQVAKTKTISFEDMTAEKAGQLTFSSNANYIGYAWKYYDLNAGKYTVDQKTVYVIKSTDGYLYKLRFVDFYNDQGLKGYPKFVYQRL